MTSLHKNPGYITAKNPTTFTKMQLFITFSFTVPGCNFIRARKFDMQKKKINIELWFEISVEWNHFLVRLKPLLPIYIFVNFFLQQLLPFPKYIFLNALEMEWCLILSKILNAHVVVLVSLLLTLNIFNTLNM